MDYSVELSVGVRGELAQTRFTVRITTPEALLSSAAAGESLLSIRATLLARRRRSQRSLRRAFGDHHARLRPSIVGQQSPALHLPQKVPTCRRFNDRLD